MQGKQAFDAKTAASIDLESFVAENHRLRQIDNILDLSFVQELTSGRYSKSQGRPSIDPEVFFRMQLVAYSMGSRQNASCATTFTTISPIAGFVAWHSKILYQITHRLPGFVTVTVRKSSSKYSRKS